MGDLRDNASMGKKKTAATGILTGILETSQQEVKVIQGVATPLALFWGVARGESSKKAAFAVASSTLDAFQPFPFLLVPTPPQNRVTTPHTPTPSRKGCILNGSMMR